MLWCILSVRNEMYQNILTYHTEAAQFRCVKLCYYRVKGQSGLTIVCRVYRLRSYIKVQRITGVIIIIKINFNCSERVNVSGSHLPPLYPWFRFAWSITWHRYRLRESTLVILCGTYCKIRRIWKKKTDDIDFMQTFFINFLDFFILDYQGCFLLVCTFWFVSDCFKILLQWENTPSVIPS